MIDRNAKEYTKLGKAFESHDWVVVREAAASKEFTEVSGAGRRSRVESPLIPQDCNYGLLEQVMNSIPRRRILKIQTMYSRMTLRDLAAMAGLSGSEGVRQVGMILQDMVSTRDSCMGRPSLIETAGRDEEPQCEYLRRSGTHRLVQ
jgi:hypothetical protein